MYPRDIGSCLRANKTLFTGLTKKIPCHLQGIVKNYNDQKNNRIRKTLNILIYNYNINSLHIGIDEKKAMIKRVFDFILLNIEFMRSLPSFISLLKVVKIKLIEFRVHDAVMEEKYDVFLE